MDLAVVGTYIPPNDWFEEMWNRYYADEYGEMPGFRFIPNEKNRMSLPDHPLICDMFIKLWLNGEIYNIVHRCRPANKQTDIYWFAWNLPPALHDEFRVLFY
jgi:hypothetical protein